MVLHKAKQKILNLEKQEKYTSYQENLGFRKELQILRNDFYYQMTSVTEKSVTIVDFLYKPIDTLSGDAYSARKIDDFQTFYLLVDGMGKGLSASLTAMIMTSFVNHIIDKMIEHDHFDLHLLIFETMSYIKNTLLDDEVLALDYIVIDDEVDTISYAKFAMPILLMQNHQDEIIKLKSNNPPMSKYQEDFRVSTYNTSSIDKFLFYSDGIVENATLNSDQTYADFIENDFKYSFTKRELAQKIFETIVDQEDDLTLIFINKLTFSTNNFSLSKKFSSSLKVLNEANEWYEETLTQITQDKMTIYKAGLTFTELYMNAYEHGILGVNSRTKHQLIEDDTYFDMLISEEKKYDKKIKVTIHKIQTLSGEYILTQISDEGKGFDTKILSEIFRNAETFNGRGVYVSKTNSMGLYYNTLGNCVLYLNKIP